MDREPVTIPGDISIEQALDQYFLRYRWPWFPVVDAAHRFLGLLQRDAADEVPEVSRAGSLVSEIVDHDRGLFVRDDTPLDSLLSNQNLRRLGALMAVDADGRLSGVITVEQVGRALRDAQTGRRPAPGGFALVTPRCESRGLLAQAGDERCETLDRGETPPDVPELRPECPGRLVPRRRSGPHGAHDRPAPSGAMRRPVSGRDPPLAAASLRDPGRERIPVSVRWPSISAPADRAPPSPHFRVGEALP